MSSPADPSPGLSPGARLAIPLVVTAVATVLAGALIVLFSARAYDWIKAVHIIAIISWMAGLLYLPRLMVYHAEVGPGTPQSETFKVMERRLLRAIMNPAMIVVWITGPWLAWETGLWRDPSVIAKFVLVCGLTVCHHLLGLWRKDFEADRNLRAGKFYRIFNEIPTILMVGIVILIVVKPI